MTSVKTPPRVVRHRSAPDPRRRRRWLLLALLVVLALAAALVWLAVGLLGAARDIRDDAESTRASLESFRTALTDGDQAAATTHLAAARATQESAADAAARTPVRVAGALPVSGTAVDDLDHLLEAAGIVVDLGDRAQGLYAQFAGEDSTVFRDNAFDLEALEEARVAAGEIDSELGRAQVELEAVKGTVPGTGAALEARDSALTQVQDLRTQIADLLPALDALPTAVGAKGGQTYMIALLNQGEMRGSGGAPLSGVVVRFRGGKYEIIQQGAFAQLTRDEGPQRETFKWDWTGKNPYRGFEQRFANSNVNPDFPTSGEEMLRSWKASTDQTLGGVIAMDVTAIGKLLEATGPLQTRAYGEVTSDNIVQLLLVDSYERFGEDIEGRRTANQELMTAMIPKLTDGGSLLESVRTLAEAVPGRHIQAYFREPALQKLTVDADLDGGLAESYPGDYVANYTVNSNGSKVDVFQERVTTVAVKLRADGSASVKQTMRVTNAAPKGFGIENAPSWYFSPRAQMLAYMYLPTDAADVKVSGMGKATATPAPDIDGRRIERRSAILILPGKSDEMVMSYTLPKGTFSTDTGLAYSLTSEPSNLQRTPTLAIRVTPPEGMSFAPQDGLTVKNGEAVMDLPLDQQRTTTIALTR